MRRFGLVPKALAFPAFLGWLVIQLGPAASAAVPGESLVIQSTELVAMLAGDQATNLFDVTIEGDLNLSRLEKVARPLRCRDCRFTGSFVATDLILERIVDFSGSTFEGPFDMSAALFRDRASFDEATFSGPVTFGSTRFFSDASFGGGTFKGGAVFDRVQFGGGALFAQAVFNADAGFQATQFTGSADFGSTRFQAVSSFAGAGFAKRVTFARAEFDREAEFRGAALSGGGNFGVRRFNRGCNFEGVSAGGSTEFLGAGLAGEGVFNNFSSTGLLALDGIRMLGGESKLFLDQLVVARFTMDVEQIEKVAGPKIRKEILKLVEKGGRESGDLALANRARFQLLDLEGADKEGLARLMDRLIFRDVSGYLVRPLHPITTLAILVLIGGLIRSERSLRQGFKNWWRGRSERSRPEGFRNRLYRGLLLSEKAISRLLSGISKAMNVAVRRKPDHIKLENPERARSYLAVGVLWGEFLVYKVVFAIFVLALGNSNSTVRQLLDAVTG